MKRARFELATLWVLENPLCLLIPRRPIEYFADLEQI